MQSSFDLSKSFDLLTNNVYQFHSFRDHSSCQMSCTLKIVIENFWICQSTLYWVKSICIRSFSGLHFPAFGLNTESIRIQSECGKIRTRKTSNTGTFHVVLLNSYCIQYYNQFSLET